MQSQNDIEQTWSLTPVMTAEAVQSLLLLLEDFQGSYGHLSQDGALNRFFNRYRIPYFLRETITAQVQKCAICHIRKPVAPVYDKCLKSELRLLIGVGETTLEQQAALLNTTTTDLGFALAGSTIMRMVIDGLQEERPEFLDSSDEEEEEEEDFRISIALETVKLSHNDKISGHRCRTRNHTVTTGGQVMDTKRLASGSNESQSVESQVSTSNVLLERPLLIHGREVNWIDSKTDFLIPGVSSAEEIQDYRTKAEKYIRLFGPGAFLWPKSGFCEGLLDDVDGLVNIAPSSHLLAQVWFQ